MQCEEKRKRKKMVNLFINSCSLSTVIDFVEALKKTPVRALAFISMAKSGYVFLFHLLLKFDKKISCNLNTYRGLRRVLFEHSL